MEETSGSLPISTRLERIAGLAHRLRDQPLTTLAHHIDLEWLREAHRRTRKDGAPGVDGQSADEYASHLEDNLRSLLERAKSGTYRAPPVRRVHIPKGSGSETRPIGIPTFEDKVLQRAVAMVLEAVYEQDFLDCSYGFRPGRSAQQALNVLHREATMMGGGWVIELDHTEVFRLDRPRAAGRGTAPSDTRWSDSAPDREVAECGSARGREREASGIGQSAGRGCVSRACEHILA
jgi:hypothetical protein